MNETEVRLNDASPEVARQQSSGKIAFRLAIWLLVGVLCAWLIFGTFPYWGLGFPFESAGTFGDTFGFVNTLFTGLAMGMMVIAIMLQTRELHLQREEIDESQKIWRQTTEAQTKSTEALERQADSLFLAGYLNGLIALKDCPAPETLTLYQEQLYSALEKILKQLEDICRVEAPPRQMGRRIVCTLAPK